MIAVVAIMAASAIAQAYQSEQARGANQRELNKLKDQFNSIIPPEYNVSVDDPIDKLAALPASPDYDISRITPEVVKTIGKYQPEMAARIVEQAPQLAEQSAAAQTGRKAQLAALEKYQQISQGGNDPELAQAMTQAAQRGDREAQSRQASVLQDQARRGALNSGAMLAGQLQASSDSSQRAAQSEQMAAAESYRNRLNALSQGASIGGQVNASEMSQAQNNADAINSFNQRQTASYQNYLNNAAQMQNQAQMRNLGESQRISELNSRNQYEGDLQNRDYQNKIMDVNYNRQVGERNAQYDAGQAARAHQEKNMQQTYTNQLNKLGRQSDIVGMQTGANTQTAQDRNQMIQTVGDLAGKGYGEYGKYQMDEERRKKEALGSGSAGTSSNTNVYG